MLGDNVLGQTTAASAAATASPTTVPLSGVTALATGPEHACAVAQNSQAWCWGGNANGQLGNGASPTGATAVPSKVLPLNKN